MFIYQLWSWGLASCQTDLVEDSSSYHEHLRLGVTVQGARESASGQFLTHPHSLLHFQPVALPQEGNGWSEQQLGGQPWRFVAHPPGRSENCRGEHFSHPGFCLKFVVAGLKFIAYFFGLLLWTLFLLLLMPLFLFINIYSEVSLICTSGLL